MSVVATFAIYRYLTRTAHPLDWWNLVLVKTNGGDVYVTSGLGMNGTWGCICAPLTEPAPCVILVAPVVTDAARVSFFESHMQS
jgi:hypothetical protein